MREANIQQAIRLALSAPGRVLFRNNTGRAWMGEAIRFDKVNIARVEKGDVLIKAARPVQFGLCEGGPDLIGWQTIEITPDMVGRKIAVFSGVEVKAERGRLSQQQINFINQAKAAGAFVGVARNVDQARAIFPTV